MDGPSSKLRICMTTISSRTNKGGHGMLIRYSIYYLLWIYGVLRSICKEKRRVTPPTRTMPLMHSTACHPSPPPRLPARTIRHLHLDSLPTKGSLLLTQNWHQHPNFNRDLLLWKVTMGINKADQRWDCLIASLSRCLDQSLSDQTSR